MSEATYRPIGSFISAECSRCGNTWLLKPGMQSHDCPKCPSDRSLEIDRLRKAIAESGPRSNPKILAYRKAKLAELCK